MTVFWTVMLCAALFFAVSTVVAIVLIGSAPRIEDDESAKRYASRHRQRSQKRVYWTQSDKPPSRREERNQPTVTPRKF